MVGINIGVIVFFRSFSVASISLLIMITRAVLLVSVALGGSGVDGSKYRFISLSSFSFWSDLVSIVSSFSSSLILLAGFYFRDAFFDVREDD